MPKLGLSMIEGSVVEWHVEPGGEISSGGIVADIETSKIVNALEVHASGVFRRGVVELGVDVPVGALIGVISEPGVSEAEIDTFIAGFTANDEASAAPVMETAAVVEASPAAALTPNTSPDSSALAVPESLAGSYDAQKVFATRHAHKLAQRLGIDLAMVAGSGRGGRISEQDVETAIVAVGGMVTESAPASIAAPEPVKTTPAVRRLAQQHGIDLEVVPATGARGQISREDILGFIERQSSAPSAAATPVDAGDNPFEEEVLSSTRRIIAGRLSQSKFTAPHYRLSVDVIVDKLLDLRRDIRNDGAGKQVSVNDMLVRALALALVEHPAVNIQFDGETVRRFVHADIAVAVALDEGLVTPVLRGADKKDLLAIAGELADMVARARTGKLLPDEFSGGTFTLSNLGMFGVKSFDAIINPPQAAILAVGKAGRRLHLGEEDSGEVATVMTATLSCDHRVIDGATGARFLQTLKDILQHPYRILL